MITPVATDPKGLFALAERMGISTVDAVDRAVRRMSDRPLSQDAVRTRLVQAHRRRNLAPLAADA
jgi:hypothetical protein